ncbi:tetratricopeptide repeat protein [Myxococcota bacterium]|nr:tetratricopeptide repeat protein [Myxococcota bacterium]
MNWRRWLPVRPRTAPPRDVDAAFRNGLLALLDRDLTTAEEQLTAAVRMDSRGVDGYLALARLYRMRGEIGRALQIHQNLLLRTDLEQRQRTAVLADLAADFRQGGFLRRAISSYEEVLAQDPRHGAALRALSRLYAEVHDFHRAIEMARRAGKVDGGGSQEDEAVLLVEMASAARVEGRLDDARRIVKRALRRNRQDVSAWLLLGELEEERGRGRAALAAWAKVLEADAVADVDVHARMEAVYNRLGRPRDFESALEKRLNRHPEDVGSRLSLAHSMARRGEIDAAVTQLREAIERDPESLDARAALGRLLSAEDRSSEALTVFLELLEVLGRRELIRRGDKSE